MRFQNRLNKEMWWLIGSALLRVRIPLLPQWSWILCNTVKSQGRGEDLYLTIKNPQKNRLLNTVCYYCFVYYDPAFLINITLDFLFALGWACRESKDWSCQWRKSIGNTSVVNPEWFIPDPPTTSEFQMQPQLQCFKHARKFEENTL